MRGGMPASGRARGILLRASSGAVALAIGTMATRMRPGSRCAMIFPDGGAGYLDTVYDDEWVERALGCGPAELASLVQLKTAHFAGAAA